MRARLASLVMLAAIALGACDDDETTGPPEEEPEVEGFALDFNDAWVTVPDAADLDLASTWTVEAWIKPRNVAASADQHFVSKWNGGGDASYSLVVDVSGRFASGVHDGVNPSQPVLARGPLAQDVWQHVAVTLNNGTRRLYIDGVLDTTFTGSLTPMNSTRPLSFGREGPPFGGWRYDGLIDEVRVWNVARTGAQITASIRMRLSGTEAGLVGYWPFDEGTGDVASDATGRGHDGQLGASVGADGNDPQWSADAAPVGS